MSRAAAVGPGQLVADRYRVGSPLGCGGLAEDEMLQRPVALRGYHVREPDRDDAGVLNEARAVARVDHPGLVGIYDVVRQGDVLWIVMEPLTGHSLAHILSVDGPLPIHRATDIGLRLLDVLKAVHQAGIVHRDVRPANVQVCADGRVVLTGFGIASFSGVPTDTRSGTPGYISPEQARGRKPDPRADLYSFGATLFAGVEGHPPFDRGEWSDSFLAVLRGTPPRTGRLGPIIDGLLAKHPERRPTADEAKAALTEIRQLDSD
ncbi:serine/threonine-protein kinase [Kribbella sp. NPDC050241]|uniref:serine/threonine-protein kinase n=1 Tax=Kribbella sp. NPDC050241 TaxID=3364115 RepID=UPI0037A19143